MTETTDNPEIFGRINSDGNVALLHSECGTPVTRLEDARPLVYPVNSDRSCCYEHPNGLVVTYEDAERLGIDIEDLETGELKAKPGLKLYAPTDTVDRGRSSIERNGTG